MTSPRPGFFSRMLRFSFLLAGLAGFLRLYGAITQQPDILGFSDKQWLPAYLMVAGGLMGLFNLTVWLVLKLKPAMLAWLPWTGVVLNITAYWLERLFLWAPAQRDTNTIWVVGIHAAWLLLAALSALQMKRRINEHNNQEIEVKFLIADLPALLEKLQNLGALMLRPRMLEVNLRFDTSDMQLGKRAQVLRLRQDDQSILTFKSPGKIVDGVISRTELEVLVSDFQTTRALLEALGFQVFMTYEKYRQNFQLNELVASVDEMPYGNFIELEGSSPEHVRATAALLGLDWDQRINLSYTALLGLYNQNSGNTFRDLSFEAFAGLNVAPSMLGLSFADSY